MSLFNYQIEDTMANLDMQKLAESLEHYSSLKYHPVLEARVTKAVRYMHEFEKLGEISNRKLATIRNVVRSCALDRTAAYNASPESEAYWCS